MTRLFSAFFVLLSAAAFAQVDLADDPPLQQVKGEAKARIQNIEQYLEDWDLSGAVDDTRALFEVGYRVTMATTWPTWKAGTEFKARRDSALATPK